MQLPGPAEITNVVKLVLLLLVLLLSANRKRAGNSPFRHGLVRTWKIALLPAFIYFLATQAGNPGLTSGQYPPFFLFSVLPLFLLAWYGLSLSTMLPGFRPLRLTAHRNSWWYILKWTVATTVLVMLVSQVISNLLLALGVKGPGNAVGFPAFMQQSSLSGAFLLLLGGAGIAEEVTYRLFATTGLSVLTRRPRAAILLSAVIFGLYHLSPLDFMYLTFWKFPLYQFITASATGIVLGWVYWYKGLEAAILGHALCDFIGLLLLTQK